MLSIADFEKPYYGLTRRGTSAQPMEMILVVIAWEPRGKGEPPISVAQLQTMIFGPGNSLADWFRENSQGRYRIVPHPVNSVIGPFVSINDWQFYWRAGQFDPNNLPQGDPHLWIGGGNLYYLDDQGFVSGHVHSYAEAIRLAASQQGINFGGLDQDHNGEITPDDCLVLVVKAQALTDGYQRFHRVEDYSDDLCGSQVPWSALTVDNVWIKEISELYAAPPHGSDDLACVIEEVLHQAADLGDQYGRPADDPGQPGQLALTTAGHRPVHVDPYHKLKWGWLNAQLADHSGRYQLHDVATTGDALILCNPYFETSEFFILENRWRGTSYDRFRDNQWQEGLALWHCIQDPQLENNWARRAVHIRRADPRLTAGGQVQDNMALFDGNDPARSYDLHDDSYPQNLRFRNGMPSRIRIRNFSPSGQVMSVVVEIPPEKGERVIVEGHINQLRVHEHETGYGPPGNQLDEDCIIKLDSEPGAAFGIDVTSPTGRRMFDRLHIAFQQRSLVRIEYDAENATGGRVIRVIETH